MRELTSLDTVIDNYDAVFCDVWGVVHDGLKAHANAVSALQSARRKGKKVILITNSPRPYAGVEIQLGELHVHRDSYDAIVTSGDATRDLICEAPKNIFHIGPDRDLSLFDGLDVNLVEEFEAAAVVCTGLFDDLNETPADYSDMLHRLRSRNLPFICANPDIVVHRGEQEIWCAGALARDYGQIGGRTLIAGKPHRPIYELAMKKLAEMGTAIDKTRILAIGDGILTDIKGAEQFGLDALFISGGIHRDNYSKDGQTDQSDLQEFLQKYGNRPVAIMQDLK